MKANIKSENGISDADGSSDGLPEPSPQLHYVKRVKARGWVSDLERW